MKVPENYVKSSCTSMYEDMHGDSILNQMRFADEREYRLTLDKLNHRF